MATAVQQDTLRSLTDEVKILRSQLFAKELAEVRLAQERHEKEAATAAAADVAARASAAAAEREQVRRGSWLNAFLSEAVDSGQGTAPIDLIELSKRIPSGDVWPAGVSASDFAFVGGPAVSDAEEFSKTFLGSLAAKKGIKF